MYKPKQVDFHQSNCADIGTALDKAARENAAKFEPAWEHAGIEVGLQIWRVEKFEIKEWPKEEYRYFYDGDAYIVMNTYKSNGSDKLKWDIHFWLGVDCSQDEAGVAAYKTVELDDFLAQAPIQHREVMGYESALFLSYFKPSISIMSGGIESGFRRVKDKADYRARLLRIVQRGKKVSSFEVPMCNGALNHGDVYILDRGREVYQWQGSGSTGMERNRAGNIARAMDDERKSRVDLFVLDGDESNDEFHAMLEGSRDDVLSKEAAEDKWDEGSGPAFKKKLFKVSDASGELTFEKVPLEARNSDDAFVLDCGTEVFVWIGKNASKQEHKMSIVRAQRYLQDCDRPPYTPITSMTEGNESELFLIACGDKAKPQVQFAIKPAPI